MNFLKNAKNKDIFKAYKFTKSVQVEKISAIQFCHGAKPHAQKPYQGASALTRTG